MGHFVLSPRNMNPRNWLPVLSYPDDKMVALGRASLGEFFGMFVWMFVALGSVPSVEATLGELAIKPESLLVISIAFGIGISIAVYMMAEVSGAHFNPTVSFSLMLLKRISVIRCIAYMLAQLAGSVVGAGALRLFITRHQAAISTLGATKLAPEIEWYQGIYIEAMLSTILNFCAIGMATYPFGRTVTPESRWSKVGPGNNTAIAVGMLVTVLNIGGIPTTGASMNPARSFGPALISWDWSNHEVYWIGPFIGCIVGTLLSLFLLVHLDAEEEDNKNFEI